VPAWRLELRRATVDQTAKLVGYVLSTYMDGAGRAQVSRSTLAECCGLENVNTIRRAVRRLELAGLLGVDRAGREQPRPSRYQARSRGAAEYAPNGPRGVSGDAPAGSQGRPKPVPGASRDRPELEVLKEGQDRSEGFGDPTTAELARDAAAAARRMLLGGES